MRFASCLAAVLLAASAATAPVYAQANGAEQSRKVSEKSRGLTTGTIGSFTPAGSAGRATGARASALEKQFSFTPAGQSRSGKDVTVGVTRRVARSTSQPAAIEPTASVAAPRPGPTAVGAGVNVGYAGFSLSGDYDRAQGRVQGSEREQVAVGFGYEARKWKAEVTAGASQPADANRIVPEPVGETVSVEVGGAYALSKRLAVKGGVRYDRIHPEAFTRDFVNRDDDQAKETGTVYLGTSLSF